MLSGAAWAQEVEAKSALAKRLLIWFWSGAIPGIAAEILGASPLLLNTYCTARYQAPRDPAQSVGWHLDANFWGFDTPLLTIWLALTNAGRDAKGLEFALPYVVRSDAEVEQAYLPAAGVKAQAGHPMSFDDGELREQIGRYRTRVPAMAPGDALIFGHTAFHRTQLGGHADRPRLAIEFRIAPRKPLPRTAGDRMRAIMTSFIDPDSGRAMQARLADLLARG